MSVYPVSCSARTLPCGLDITSPLERVSVPTGKLHPLRSMRYIFFVYNSVQAQWSTPLLLLVLYTPVERRNTRMYRKNGRLYRFRSFQNG